jgi:hypothetical protein
MLENREKEGKKVTASKKQSVHPLNALNPTVPLSKIN